MIITIQWEGETAVTNVGVSIGLGSEQELRVSEEWLRRFWQGSCDGAVYDVAELYPLHPQRFRPWDSVVNYTLLVSEKPTSKRAERIQTLV